MQEGCIIYCKYLLGDKQIKLKEKDFQDIK